MGERSSENQGATGDSSKRTVPKVEVNWLLFTFTDLEPKSLAIGVVAGITIALIVLHTFGPKAFLMSGSLDGDVARQYVKLYESSTNKPQTLEGSHYTLAPEKEYRIEVVNPEKQYDEIVWELVPNNFGEIDFKPEFITAEKLYAIYSTPQVPDGSSGIIKVCELAESSICRVLNLPEINVVISK